MPKTDTKPEAPVTSKKFVPFWTVRPSVTDEGATIYASRVTEYEPYGGGGISFTLEEWEQLKIKVDALLCGLKTAAAILAKK